MNFNEYITDLKDLQEANQHIKRQLCCLQALQWAHTREKFQVGVEYRATYDLPELLEEYSWKANKCHYFLSKYIDLILQELAFHEKHMESMPNSNNIFIGKTTILDEATYNFDAFVLAASALMEGEGVGYMEAYLRKTPVVNYYPKKHEIGLYWQLNLLRNRIVHHTGGRYENGEVCQRYFDFSSRINGIRFKNEHIELECSQIDVYRSSEVQKEIARVLSTGDDKNVFERLFPEKSGKGHGKKNPGVLYPGVILYFDHVSSGTRFVSEIQQFILNMNEAFFVEFSHKIKNKTSIPEVGMIYHEDGVEVKCQVKELFDISKIPMPK